MVRRNHATALQAGRMRRAGVKADKLRVALVDNAFSIDLVANGQPIASIAFCTSRYCKGWQQPRILQISLGNDDPTLIDGVAA